MPSVLNKTRDGMFYRARPPNCIRLTNRVIAPTDCLQKIHNLVEQLLRVSPDAYTDALHASLRGISAAQIADAMSSHLRIPVDEKQELARNFFRPRASAKIDCRFSKSKSRKNNLTARFTRTSKSRWTNISANII